MTSTPAAEPGLAVEVTDLHRTYRAARRGTPFEAVRGVSFGVRRGELFALLGTNGAGKTSTLEVVEGLAAPTSGRVRVLGHDPHRERAAVRPRMGVVLQSGGFPGDLTVGEALRMWAGTLTDARPVEETLALTSMADRAGVPVSRLSGGERRRLDLAAALLNRPEVLFLDEPTAGLDPESRRDTWEVVRDLLGAGSTVVLTTHYLEEAEALADRLAILHRGRVVLQGTTADIAEAQPARISFASSDIRLPELPGATVADDGRRTTLRTKDLQATLTALLGWAAAHGTHLRDLDARSASLEETFLAVAEGRSELTHDTTEVAA